MDERTQDDEKCEQRSRHRMKGNEDLARSIIPVSSDPSGFSRGTRRTQKPLSSLWKVTRSIKPEICSVEGRRSGHSCVGFILPRRADAVPPRGPLRGERG